MRTDYKILKINNEAVAKIESNYLLELNHKKYLFKEVKKEVDKNYYELLKYIVIQYLWIVLLRVWRTGFAMPFYREYFGTLSIGKLPKNIKAVSYTKSELNLNLTEDCYKHWFVTYNNGTDVRREINAYKFTIAKTLIKDYSVHNENQTKLPFSLMELIREIGSKHIPFKPI